MKIEELRTKNKEELLSMLVQHKKELMNLRFQMVSGSLVNTSRIRFVRKVVAKIKTLLNNSFPTNFGVKKDA